MADLRCLGDQWLDAHEVIRLVRDAQRGEPCRLDALLATLRPMVVRFFARRLPWDAAEDLAQVVLVRVARSLGRIDPERAADFLVTVAENRLRSELRRRAREARVFAPLEVPEEVPAPDAPDREAEMAELAGAIEEACRTVLRPAQRAVVAGLLIGLRPSELAAEYQVPMRTIQTRLRRARALLRVELARYREPAWRPRCVAEAERSSVLGPSPDGDARKRSSDPK